MVQILKATRQPPDNADDYRMEFGYLGPALQAAVTRARSQPSAPASSSGSVTATAGRIQRIFDLTLLEDLTFCFYQVREGRQQ